MNRPPATENFLRPLPIMKCPANRNDFCRRSKRTAFALLIFGVIDAMPAKARADGDGELAISSMTRPDYVRSRLADGSAEPETYVYGRGGAWTTCINDATIDQMTFKEVARITTASLARQKYLPAKNPNEAKLLIRIYWGTTGGVDDTPAAVKNRRNAALMGYESVLAKSIEYRDTPFSFRYSALATEFYGGAFGRYFVVLIAYDYQLMRRQKKEIPLWVTRFSIPGRGNAFDQELAAMTRAASSYFGRPSNGLTHENLPEGHVSLGELNILGVEPETKSPVGEARVNP